MTEPIDIPQRTITGDEYVLSVIKHTAWEQLQEFIKRKEERNDGYCEFAESWRSEFMECMTECDIKHFIKDFKLKPKQNV